MAQYFETNDDTIIEQQQWIETKRREENVDSRNLGQMAVIRLLHATKFGLPDVYQTPDDFFVDFWADLGCTPEETKKDVETILADPRFERIASYFEQVWNFDIRAIIEAGLEDC